MSTSTRTAAPTRAAQGAPFVAHAASFAEVLGEDPRLVQAVATDAHEGPVYVAGEDALYFTTLPRPVTVPAPGFRESAIGRLALDGERFPLEPERLSIVRPAANMANGMTADHQGHLIVCEQGTRSEHARIGRFDPATGETGTVVDRWHGLRLNSPNDVVEKSDGTIWFTDPTYGFLQGFRPEPLIGDYVYRFDPGTEVLTVVADSFDKPNGLAFSPDERVLYVGDSGANQEEGSYFVGRPHHILAFDVVEGKHLANQRLFAVITPGFPDGIKVDSSGRVYASSLSGVQVFDPEGDLIGEIRLPGVVNFTFGGRGGSVLFITGDSAIWAAVLGATGPAPVHPPA
jgi:gluconolactonase